MKTLYVRIHKKQPAETFYRCGLKFGKAWAKCEHLDAATARCLEEEQMLEVSATQPADYVEKPAAGDSAPAIAAETAAPADTPAAAPEQPEQPEPTGDAAPEAVADAADAADATSAGAEVVEPAEPAPEPAVEVATTQAAPAKGKKAGK